MTTQFTVGHVDVDVLDGVHPFTGVPTSQWHGDKTPQTGTCALANMRTDDGLRAQVALVTWPSGDEVSLRLSELLGGPADYERLKGAGELAPKIVGTSLVARVRALKYKDGSDRASLDAIDWTGLDELAAGDARAIFSGLGAIKTGTYADLFPPATRFKLEPAVEVSIDNPAALFAVYALTRVVPIVKAHGKTVIEGPNA